MRRILLGLACMPAIAWAGPSPKALSNGARTVEIAAQVDAPLLRSARGLPAVVALAPAKNARSRDRELIVSVELADGPSRVSLGTAQRYGWRIRHTTIDSVRTQTVVIPELRIGDLTLRRIPAIVDDTRCADGVCLAASTLKEAGTAILVSKGSVRFVPAEAAPALVTEVGTPLAAKTFAGSFMEDGRKVYIYPFAYATVANVGGTDGYAVFGTTQPTTQVRELLNPIFIAGIPSGPVDVQVGGLTWPVDAEQRNLLSPDDGYLALVGWDALHTYDTAIDPSHSGLSLSKVTPAPVPYAGIVALSQAKADYEFAIAEGQGDKDKKGSKAPTDTSTGDVGKPVVSNAELAYGLALEDAALARDTTSTPEALAHLKAATETAGDGCEAPQAYGNALIALSGDPTSAIPLLRRAGELYDRWDAQDSVQRARVIAGKRSTLAFTVPQPSSCSTAWGDLAGAYLAVGDHAKVEEIYREHVAADPDLPLAYGLSLLTQGRSEDAIVPLKQAMELDGKYDSRVRVALTMAGEQASIASPGLDRVRDSRGLGSLVTLAPVVEAARSRGGNPEALSAAEGLVGRGAHSVPALLLLSREVDDAARPAALARVDEAWASYVVRYGEDSSALAWKALAQTIGGDAAGGRSALSAQNPTANSETRMATAIAARDDGDFAAAIAALADLRNHDPLSPSTAIDVTRIDDQPPGLPGSPRPPLKAPASVYNKGCGTVAPLMELDGTWASGSSQRIAFQGQRFCVFDAAVLPNVAQDGSVSRPIEAKVVAKGKDAGWTSLACPAVAPAADAAPQETYLILANTTTGVTTCNRWVAVGGRFGVYGEACPAPQSTTASPWVGQYARSGDVAPAECWTNSPLAGATPKKSGK